MKAFTAVPFTVINHKVSEVSDKSWEGSVAFTVFNAEFIVTFKTSLLAIKDKKFLTEINSSFMDGEQTFENQQMIKTIIEKFVDTKLNKPVIKPNPMSALSGEALHKAQQKARKSNHSYWA